MPVSVSAILPLLCLFVLSACRSDNRETFSPQELTSTEWQDLVSKSRGTEVAFAMWAGDEARNRHFRGPVTEELQARYGIRLRLIPYSDTAEAINKLLNEKSAGRTTAGSTDILWINGENFRMAKQGEVLWGPFAQSLPNIAFYPPWAGLRDFGTPVDGFEAPWQRAQFVFAHDTARVAVPPRSLDALARWIKAHRGRFTYIAPPDFTGSAFIRHVLVHFGDSPEAFRHFDPDHYTRASTGALRWLKEIRPFLWRRGETYPATASEQDRLFANSEIDFAMSYSPAFASVRIERGEFPPTTRTFVFDSGTLGNYNFLAIPFNAANVPGALVTINEFLSFDHLLQLSRTLHTQFPLDLPRLTPEQREAVETLPRGPATLPDSVLTTHFIPEPHAEYLIRFERDWRDKVLRQ